MKFNKKKKIIITLNATDANILKSEYYLVYTKIFERNKRRSKFPNQK